MKAIERAKNKYCAGCTKSEELCKLCTNSDRVNAYMCGSDDTLNQAAAWWRARCDKYGISPYAVEVFLRDMNNGEV